MSLKKLFCMAAISAALGVQAVGSVAAQPSSKHNFAAEDEGRYGYESEISQVDRASGIADKPLIMFRYLGVSGGRYYVERIVSPYLMQRMSCDAKCAVIKVEKFAVAEPKSSSLIRNNHQTVISAVMDDAIAGRLAATPSPNAAAFPFTPDN